MAADILNNFHLLKRIGQIPEHSELDLSDFERSIATTGRHKAKGVPRSASDASSRAVRRALTASTVLFC